MEDLFRFLAFNYREYEVKEIDSGVSSFQTNR